MTNSSSRMDTIVTTDWLAAHLHEPDLRVLDGTWHMPQLKRDPRAEFAQAHIPGAVFFDIDAIADHGTTLPHMLPTAAEFAAAVGALGIGSGDRVVVYDVRGVVSAARVWWTFRAFGHDAVAVLDGGIGKWMREGRPVTTKVSEMRPAAFPIRKTERPVSAADVLASLGDGSLKLVDARGAERFRGEMEVIDPVAGHIPGAVNRPYTENILVDGTFKSAEELRAELAAIVGDTAPSKIVNVCGSGVSACHNLLAMEIAGIGGTTLYPGSWSEWVADPSRPVATGPESG
jgi:thiosulfate/3-mercaptopyruvate sulfurtransferase